jgi:hypothetical protein
MFDLTLIFIAVCVLTGYAPFLISEIVLKRDRYNILSYSKKLFFIVGISSLIGFLIGFLGPIFLSPGANQGPLLGIFITGPAGAILGLAVFWGILFWKRKST